MLIQKKTINNVPQFIHLTADTGTGAPVGSYLYLEKKSNPQGYLYCDGSTFDETAYPALYQYLGTNVLPDWREFSAVGAEQNTTSSVIATHDVFTQGQEKDDQIQDHSHKLPRSTSSGGSSLMAIVQQSTTVINITPEVLDSYTPMYSGNKGTVTRGKRKAVFIYIKATSGLTENQQEDVLNTINENNSYSTEEHPTGKKWIDGKPIYSKVIDCGALPNATTKSIAHNISNYGRIINISGFAYSGANTSPLPKSNPTNAYGIDVRVEGSYIVIQTGVDRTDYTGYVTIEYTKTTD